MDLGNPGLTVCLVYEKWSDGRSLDVLKKPAGRVKLIFPLAYMGSIFGISSIPGTPTAEDPTVFTVVAWIPPKIQNLLHIPLFGVLAWLWVWSLRDRMKRGRPLFLTAFLLTAVYGVFDELHQAFVPGRYASLTDISLNVIGAALAIGGIATAKNRT